MDIRKTVGVYGDSILKGIQLKKDSMRYCVDNNIDISGIESKFDLTIDNKSRFGCTITKGELMLGKSLEKGMTCDAVVMDWGGNDCDFNWKEISSDPEATHLPNTPLDSFIAAYRRVIDMLREHGIKPILTNLPPIDANKYLNWLSANGMNRENLLRWLGDAQTIYRYQENYSRVIERIAREKDCLLVDLRGAFLSHRRISELFCDDGIHPNTDGQRIISEAFESFASAVLPRATSPAEA